MLDACGTCPTAAVLPAAYFFYAPISSLAAPSFSQLGSLIVSMAFSKRF